jgi:hypothetical protein
MVIDANVPSNRVEPWKGRLARAISMPHFVNAKPGFLQQIIRVPSADGLRDEEPIQLRADAFDQIRGRGEIALLIAGHQCFEIAVRAHSSDCLLAIFISASVFAQIAPTRHERSQTQFNPIPIHSMESGKKLRRGQLISEAFYLHIAGGANRDFSQARIE